MVIPDIWIEAGTIKEQYDIAGLNEPHIIAKVGLERGLEREGVRTGVRGGLERGLERVRREGCRLIFT